MKKNKISTKYFNKLFKYINTFEEKDRHPAFASQFETTIDAIFEVKKIINKKINFLDLGCGLGNVLFIAKEILGNDNKYVGIDNNQSYLDVAKFVDGKFHLLNTDLFSPQTTMAIRNANIIYCYLPFGYKKMQELYKGINNYAKKGTYFICNDENTPDINTFKKINTFEGIECCNKTEITIYKQIMK